MSAIVNSSNLYHFRDNEECRDLEISVKGRHYEFMHDLYIAEICTHPRLFFCW